MTAQLATRHVNGRIVARIEPDAKPTPRKPRRDPSGLAPADVEAEQAVLGACLIGSEIPDSVAMLLAPEHFSRPGHAALYGAMLALRAAATPIDLVTVVAELDRVGALAECGGMLYLIDLQAQTPIATHARHYAEIVRRRATDRAMIDVAGDFARMAYDGDEDALAFARGALAKLDFDIRRAETGDVYEALCALTAPRPDGWSTGIPVIDYWLGEVGLVPERSLTITGKPGTGKTMLAGLMAVNALRAGARVMFATLEMSKREIMARLGIAMLGKRAFRLLRAPEKWEEFDWDTYRMVIAAVEGMPGTLAILEEQHRADDIAVYARRFRADVLFVDFYQLLQFDVARGETNDSADKANAGLLCRDLPRQGKLCTVVVSQLTRDGRMKYGAWCEALSHAWLHIDPIDGSTQVKIEPRKNRWGGSSHTGTDATFDTDFAAGRFERLDLGV